MSDSRTAIVVGGGLVGCFTAYYLRQFGLTVTLLDRDGVGAGASHGNCGYVCPSHALPLSIPGAITRNLPALWKSDSSLAIPLRFDPGLWSWLLRFSRQCSHSRMMTAAAARNALLASSMKLYREWLAEEAVDCQWRDEGLLLVFQSSREFDEYGRTAELLDREFGIATRCYAGEEVKQFEPTLRSGMAGGWHFPNDAHVRPDRLVDAVRENLEARGVVIQRDTLVERIDGGDTREARLQTSAGPLAADVVVLAAGAESARFAHDLGCPIPIQPGKGYSITTPPLKRPPRTPMIFETHHVAVTPFADGFRVGSTMEFAGFDRSLNPRRLDLLRRSAGQHLEEELPAEELETWAGWRPMVYDGIPCIGQPRGAARVVLATGNGMIGLATATATGKLAAELAVGETPHIDPAPYSPARFQK